MHATWPTYLNLLDIITLILRVKYKFWNSFLRDFLCLSVTSFHFSLNILHTILFLDTSIYDKTYKYLFNSNNKVIHY
jgi:hypothetical protein